MMVTTKKGKRKGNKGLAVQINHMKQMKYIIHKECIDLTQEFLHILLKKKTLNILR